MNFEPKKFHGLFQYYEFGVLPREIAFCCFEIPEGKWIVEIKGISVNIQDILLNLMPKVKKIVESIDIDITKCEIYVIRVNESIKLTYDAKGDFNYSVVNDYIGKCKCDLMLDGR